MRYTVTTKGAIDFAPSSEVAEILQNVRTIISTRVGSVPLARDFGVSWDNVDKPYPFARSLQKEAIIDAIQEFEPRAKVDRVEFDNNAIDAIDGILACRVIVLIEDEEKTEEDW